MTTPPQHKEDLRKLTENLKSRNLLGYARNGLYIFELDSFTDFIRLIETSPTFQHSNKYIFRGHADAAWHLEAGLTRRLKQYDKVTRALKRKQLLLNFRKKMRGKRNLDFALIRHIKYGSPTITPSAIRYAESKAPYNMTEEDAEIWASGQHHGLATPLLDWSESPLTALHFAFDSESKADYRAVFILDRELVELKTAQIRDSSNEESQTLEIIDTNSNENDRVIAQFGMFSLCSHDIPVETWVTKNFCSNGPFVEAADFLGKTTMPERDLPVLIKFLIPNENQRQCLEVLNRFNVNASTIFPDINGISKHANWELNL